MKFFKLKEIYQKKIINNYYYIRIIYNILSFIYLYLKEMYLRYYLNEKGERVYTFKVLL